MTNRPHITIQPIYQHAVETQRAGLWAIIFIGAILLCAATAYQAVQVDRQMAIDARV